MMLDFLPLFIAEHVQGTDRLVTLVSALALEPTSFLVKCEFVTALEMISDSFLSGLNFLRIGPHLLPHLAMALGTIWGRSPVSPR